ncbi:MAG: zinc-dependent dehydrogenase [Anaerolineae bacterium]
MKAAYFYGPGDIRVEDVETPCIQDNEMLMRVRASSICGTDLRISKYGHFKIPAGQRRVLGHEIAGDIVQVGRLVEGYGEGMRVTVTPNIGCGVCEMCRDGYNNMCPNYEAFGISIDGGFEEYMRIPNIAIKGGNVFPIPDHLGYAEAALTEPLSCCYNALRSVSTSHTDTVLVIGAGPIGTMHVILNRIAGAKKIIVADIRQSRLDNIRQFGAHVTINSAEVDLKDALMAETGGRGADVVITAVSSAELQTQAVELLATHGRVNFFAGLGKDALASIDTNRVHYKGLRLVGTTGSTNADYYKCLALVAEGRAEVGKMISAEFPLDDISAALEFAASGQGLKAVVTRD